jgi:hypothetical protein
MLKKVLMSALVFFLATASVLSADSTETQIVGATISGAQINVWLHNPDFSPDTTRVQVSVGLADGTIQTLVTGNVTVESGSTTSVSIAASAAIVSIIEDPQPFTPAP